MDTHIIHVSRGSAARIEAAIRDYAEYDQEGELESYIVKLYDAPGHSYYVTIEPDFPGFHFNNLTYWLDDAPDHSTVGDAVGWWCANEEHWYFTPGSNETGTITKPEDEVFTCHLLRNGICPSPEIDSPYVEPPVELGEFVLEFSIITCNFEDSNNPDNDTTDRSEEELSLRFKDEEKRSSYRTIRGCLLIAIPIVIVLSLAVYGAWRLVWPAS